MNFLHSIYVITENGQHSWQEGIVSISTIGIRHGLPRSLHAIIDRYDVDYPIRRETFILIPTYIWIES